MFRLIFMLYSTLCEIITPHIYTPLTFTPIFYSVVEFMRLHGLCSMVAQSANTVNSF